MEVVTDNEGIMGNAHPEGLYLGIGEGRYVSPGILGEEKSVSWFWEFPMNLFKHGRLGHFYDDNQT